MSPRAKLTKFARARKNSLVIVPFCYPKGRKRIPFRFGQKVPGSVSVPFCYQKGNGNSKFLVFFRKFACRIPVSFLIVKKYLVNIPFSYRKKIMYKTAFDALEVCLHSRP